MRRAIWTILGASIWSLAAGLAAWQLTVPWGTFAAVCGSLLGIILGRRLAVSRVRLAAIWGLGLLLLGLASALAVFLKQSTLAALIFGPSGAYTVAEMWIWFFLCSLLVGILQASSRRVPAFIAIEIAAVGAVFAGLFAAHRGGFINRPYFLVDPLWARGYDPVPFFMAIGAGVAALLVILAASRSSRRRSLLDLGLLCALILAIFVVFPAGKIKDLNPPFGGGGSKDQEDKNKRSEAKDQGTKGKSDAQGGRNSSGKTGGQEPAAGQSGQSAPPNSGGGASSGASGSPDSLTPFADQQSQQGNPPVAVVLLHDDYDPPSGYFYFRQTAFSQYNGRRLVQDSSGKADRDVAEAFPTASLPMPRWPVDKTFVRPLKTTVALMAQHPRPFALTNPEVIDPIPNPDPTRFQRAYQVTSEVMAKNVGEFAGLPMGAKAWDRELWKHYTEHPSDPRYAGLAEKTVQMLRPEYREDPFAEAAAIKFWLEKNSTYSLASDHDNSADPVADFLFGDRVGHCVYFAHAACLLFRERGIPARVGAGYAVNARNRGGGAALLVREKDSHAWPEIYLEGAGWVVMDIAPEKILSPPEESPDQDLQQMLGEMARQDAGNPKQEQQPAGKGNLQNVLKQILKAAGAAAALLAGLFILCLYGTKLWRRLIPRFCKEAQLPRLSYRACLDRLADVGFVRVYGQTRETFARSGGSRALECLTTLHLASALGAGAPAEGRECYLGLGNEASRDITRRFSFVRRFLGLLNPFSWLWVK